MRRHTLENYSRPTKKGATLLYGIKQRESSMRALSAREEADEEFGKRVLGIYVTRSHNLLNMMHALSKRHELEAILSTSSRVG